MRVKKFCGQDVYLKRAGKTDYLDGTICCANLTHSIRIASMFDCFFDLLDGVTIMCLRECACYLYCLI